MSILSDFTDIVLEKSAEIREAMAFSTKDIKQKLIQINDSDRGYWPHILKIIYYGGKTSNDNHWKEEILAFLSKASSDKIKGSNKKPSAQFYIEYFFELNCESLSDFENKVVQYLFKLKRDYGEPKKVDISVAYSAYKKFYKKVAEIMSKKDIRGMDLFPLLEPLFSFGEQISYIS